MSKPVLDIVDAMNHRKLFQPWFSGESWNGWRAILKAAFCLPMTDAEIEFFRSVAERYPPRRRVKELWIIGGRRSGKDSIASLIASHAAMFFQPGASRLRPGERALVQCLACDRDQASIVLDFTRSYFQDIAPLRAMVSRQTKNGFELNNSVDVQVTTNSFRSARGRTVLVSIFDEVSFWMDDRSARPDWETYRAVRPSMATLPESMLIGISTPGKRAGLLYDKYRKHYGVDDDDVLVIKAATSALNHMVDAATIAKDYEDDPQVAAAEWGGEFRDDLVAYIDPETVEACVSRGVREVLPVAQGVQYFGFTDPSGGSSDSMTMAIGHRAGEKVVIDCVLEQRPPFKPDQCVLEFCAMLRAYGVTSIQSDRYAGAWVVERFAAHGVTCAQSAKPKSALYVELLPLLNSGRIELLDHPRLISQLCSLERRVERSGKDSIDHPKGGHDDVINCVAGVAALALGHQGFRVTAADLPDLLGRIAQLQPRRGAYGGRQRNVMFMPTQAQQSHPFMNGSAANAINKQE